MTVALLNNLKHDITQLKSKRDFSKQGAPNQKYHLFYLQNIQVDITSTKDYGMFADVRILLDQTNIPANILKMLESIHLEDHSLQKWNNQFTDWKQIVSQINGYGRVLYY